MYTEQAVKAALQAIRQYKEHFLWDDLTQLVAVHCFLLQGIQSVSSVSQFGFKATNDEIRLIWNRLNSFHQLLEFQNTGIKAYKISSCGDGCKKCKQPNRKKFSVANAIVGETAPPFCDKCRCIMLFSLRKSLWKSILYCGKVCGKLKILKNMVQNLNSI